jgi:hypothetical protein
MREIKMNEIDIMKDVAKRLNKIHIDYMISGSVAMNFYATPRMTRDIDIVILIEKKDIESLYNEFYNDYYIDKDMIESAIINSNIFNIIHLNEVIKIDFIIRKNTKYRLHEFSKKNKVLIDDLEINIVSLEDLIISKLIWAKDSQSEIQINDIKNLLKCKYDLDYLKFWSEKLKILDFFNRIINEN